MGDSTPIAGKLVRNVEGQYIKGISGNPVGRPKGSKNKITLLKMIEEESWRERNADKLSMVLDMILDDAIEGNPASRKMIFDAIVSKANVQEDKSAGHKQTITVHKMTVQKEDPTPTEEE